MVTEADEAARLAYGAVRRAAERADTAGLSVEDAAEQARLAIARRAAELEGDRVSPERQNGEGQVSHVVATSPGPGRRCAGRANP